MNALNVQTFQVLWCDLIVCAFINIHKDGLHTQKMGKVLIARIRWVCEGYPLSNVKEYGVGYQEGGGCAGGNNHPVWVYINSVIVPIMFGNPFSEFPQPKAWSVVKESL
jgi:hypothetical protein